jgi:hypothetical protein
MALSWRNLPCALKAAIGIGKRTLGRAGCLPRHRGRSKALSLIASGVAASLDETEVAFRERGTCVRSLR